MSDAAFFREFIAALKLEMKAAGQPVTRLKVAWKQGVATLPLRGRKRFVIRREHVVSIADTPAEMASAVYAVYLEERSGREM